MLIQRPGYTTFILGIGIANLEGQKAICLPYVLREYLLALYIYYDCMEIPSVIGLGIVDYQSVVEIYQLSW